MTYRDQNLTCAKCSKVFMFRVEEQRAQEDSGSAIAIPTTCPACRQEITLEPGLRAGTVKWYRPEKRFGFIVQPDKSEVFFHRVDVIDEDTLAQLQENTPIWYELIATERGAQAVNVHLRD